VRRSGDAADRFTADPVTPQGPHASGTRIAHRLRDATAEAVAQSEVPVAGW